MNFRSKVQRADYKKIGGIGSVTHREMFELGGTAKALIATRTAQGEDADGTTFMAYSTDRYYAPVENRPAGYPAPAGGRTTALRGGRELKSMAFDGGYAEYKAGLGFGSTPQLSVSQQMIGSIAVFTPNDHTALLVFLDPHEELKAQAHHEGIGVPKREWFDVGETTSIQEMELRLDELIREQITRAGL